MRHKSSEQLVATTQTTFTAQDYMDELKKKQLEKIKAEAKT